MTFARDSIVVHEFGNPNGPTLVLLHGVTDSGLDWPDAVARWGEAYRILALDLRGHGVSPRFAEDELVDVAAIWLADVLAVLRAQSEPPVVAGHSLGACLALLADATEPGLIGALVLEDPPLPSSELPRDQASFGKMLRKWVTSFSDAEGRAGHIVQARQTTPWSAAEIEAWAASKAKVDQQMLEHLNLPEIDWGMHLVATTTPTLLLLPKDEPLGGADLRAVELAPALAANNPNVTVTWIAGVGHCMRRDNLAAYHNEVDPFLDVHS
ncbi:MAG: alpha/beta hydrolase [Promicromonosporaceae bacterium]|nr:alpha/beta hydrolase [Promicromonosporaceae bacterium]